MPPSNSFVKRAVTSAREPLSYDSKRRCLNASYSVGASALRAELAGGGWWDIDHPGFGDQSPDRSRLWHRGRGIRVADPADVVEDLHGLFHGTGLAACSEQVRQIVAQRQVTITVTSLGADAGLYGAGWLALESAGAEE